MVRRRITTPVIAGLLIGLNTAPTAASAVGWGPHHRPVSTVAAIAQDYRATVPCAEPIKVAGGSFCLSLIHEMGHLFGRQPVVTRGRVMGPVFIAGAKR